MGNIMPDDQILQKWQRWLDTIYNEVQRLLINRHIFWEVQQIIKSNPKIQTGSAFYDFMGIIYPTAQVMGVRRQLDIHKGSVSFANLLKDIERNPQILSRERYLGLCKGSKLPDDVHQSEFDRYAGIGNNYIDNNMILQDLIKLKHLAEKLRKYANKRIAHFDEGEFNNFPTYADLDSCLDYLELLLKKYILILRCEGGEILPVFVYDWKRIFRFPWIE